MCEKNDLQDQSLIHVNKKMSQIKRLHFLLYEQTLSLSNRSITTTSTISENEDKNFSQQLRETHVMVNLFDCMECYVRIPRCDVTIERNRWEVTLLFIFFFKSLNFRLKDTIIAVILIYKQHLIKKYENDEKKKKKKRHNNNNSSQIKDHYKKRK